MPSLVPPNTWTENKIKIINMINSTNHGAMMLIVFLMTGESKVINPRITEIDTLAKGLSPNGFTNEKMANTKIVMKRKGKII